MFHQQGLGRAWEETGEAPDDELLDKAREPYPQRVVPPEALFLTGACDVQGNRLEWSVWAWGAGLTCWLVDRGILQGETADEVVWRQLDGVIAQTYPDLRGNRWPIDLFGVDTGFLANWGYMFARRHAATQRVLALKGEDGWHRLPVGSASKMDVDFAGRRIGTVMLFPVGTWSMKSETYAGLRKTLDGPAAADGQWKVGTVHLPGWIDREAIRQLTAEFFTETTDKRGRTRKEWVKAAGRANELLDMHVYSRALAHHLYDPLQPAEVLSLAARRNVAAEGVQRDLFAAAKLAEAGAPEGGVAIEAAPDVRPPPAAQEPEGAEPPREGDWFGVRGDDWFTRH